jgi:hypothetical protein
MRGFSLALTLLVLISPMPLGYNLGANGAIPNGSEATVGAAGLADAMANGGLDAGVPSFVKLSEVFQVCPALCVVSHAIRRTAEPTSNPATFLATACGNFAFSNTIRTRRTS